MCAHMCDVFMVKVLMRKCFHAYIKTTGFASCRCVCVFLCVMDVVSLLY